MLLETLDREADELVATGHATRERCRQIALPDMDAGSTRRQGHIGPVVHDHRHAERSQPLDQGDREAEKRGRRRLLVTKLHKRDAGARHRLDQGRQDRGRRRDPDP